MLKQLPYQRTEFIEVNKCNFVYPYEPKIMFNLMRDQFLFKNVRYLTIQRSKLCQDFIHPHLCDFLTEDKSLHQFSFVMNNQALALIDDNEEEEVEKKSKKAMLRMSSTIEKEMQESGLKNDLNLLKILEAAIGHSSLEIV